MRQEHQAPAEFVTTTYTPARLASLESDVFVPTLQACAIGLGVGLAAGCVTLLFGGPVAGLEGGDLWAWAGRIGAGSGVVSLAGSVVVFTLGARRLLWAREEWQGRDIDGDGTVGRPEPPRVRVEWHDPTTKRTKYIDLPATVEQLGRVAVAVLRNGKAFSRPALRGTIPQAVYRRLASEMVRRGLARDLPGNKRELTPAGRAILRKFLD